MCQWADPADKHTIDPFCKTSSPRTITIYTRFKTSSTKTHDLHCFSDFLHQNLTIPLIFSPVSPLCRWTCGESNGHNFPPQRHVFFPSFFTFSTSTTRYLRCFSSSPASKTWYLRCFWHLPTTFLSFFLHIYDHAIYHVFWLSTTKNTLLPWFFHLSQLNNISSTKKHVFSLEFSPFPAQQRGICAGFHRPQLPKHDICDVFDTFQQPVFPSPRLTTTVFTMFFDFPPQNIRRITIPQMRTRGESIAHRHRIATWYLTWPKYPRAHPIYTGMAWFFGRFPRLPPPHPPFSFHSQI